MRQRVTWLAIACAVLCVGVAQAQTTLSIDFEDGSTMGVTPGKDGTDVVADNTTAGGGTYSARVEIDGANHGQDEGGWVTNTDGSEVTVDEIAGWTTLTFSYMVPASATSVDGQGVVVNYINHVDGWSGGAWYGNGLWGVLVADGQWHDITFDLTTLGEANGGWQGGWGDQESIGWTGDDPNLLYHVEIFFQGTNDATGEFLYIDNLVFSDGSAEGEGEGEGDTLMILDFEAALGYQEFQADVTAGTYDSTADLSPASGTAGTLQMTYDSSAANGWGQWQCGDVNNAPLDLSSYTHINFWAKGPAGGNISIELGNDWTGVGGETSGPIEITTEWAEYSVPVADFEIGAWVFNDGTGDGFPLDWSSVQMSKILPRGADGEFFVDDIYAFASGAEGEGEGECDVIVNGTFDDASGWTLTNLNTGDNGVIPNIAGGQGLIEATGHGNAAIWQTVTLDASTTYDFEITWGTDNTDIHYWAEVYVTGVDQQVPEENVDFNQFQDTRILADGVLMPNWDDPTTPQTRTDTVEFTPPASGDYVIVLKSGQCCDAVADNAFTTWFDSVSMTIQGCTPAEGPAGIYIDGPPWAELGSVVQLVGPSGGTGYAWSRDGVSVDSIPNATATGNVLYLDPVIEEHQGLWTLTYDDGTKAIVELTHFLSVVDQVPVSGLLGLGALVAACGIGGARMLRRKTQR